MSADDAAKTMRAYIARAYGGPAVLEMTRVPRPVPREDEVLVRVMASTVTSGDARMRAFKMPGGFWLPGRLALGITRPRQAIPGTDFAGEVVEVGRAVTRFKAGDRVFGLKVGGATHADYMRVKQEQVIAAMPAGLSFEDAAALPFGATSALHYLKAADIKPGQTVLINGASGSVGSAAVQIARSMGALVTAACSVANRELMLSLGASRAIDYAAVLEPGDGYDVVFDTQGKISPSAAVAMTKPGGVFLPLVLGLGEMLQRPKGIRMVRGMADAGGQMPALLQLIERGEIRAVIDSVLPFEQLREAHARVDGGHKRGNVVVRIAA